MGWREEGGWVGGCPITRSGDSTLATDDPCQWLAGGRVGGRVLSFNVLIVYAHWSDRLE